jgi:mRNA interferase MazF
LALKRGDIVTIAARGAYTGKPRPAVVVQSNLFNATHASITVCPITSDCVDAPLFRVTLLPGARTGLRAVSQVMVDKATSLPRDCLGKELGSCDADQMAAIEEALRVWLDLR